MSSKEFSRIVRDLSTIGENVEITVDKEGAFSRWYPHLSTTVAPSA